MKRISEIRTVRVLLCFTLLASTLTFTYRGVASQLDTNQGPLGPSAMVWPAGVALRQDVEPGVQVLRSEVLDQARTASVLAALSKSDLELQALSKEFTALGYQAQPSPANHFGWDVDYRRLLDGQIANFEILVQNYTRAGSRDPGAIGTVRINAYNRCEVYSFFVIAPAGDHTKAIEYTVDGETLKVVRANSLWSCFVNRVKSKCVGPCIAALGTCSGPWAAYLGCVVLACGGCAAAALVCCTCNSKWWCSFVAGSCHT